MLSDHLPTMFSLSSDSSELSDKRLHATNNRSPLTWNHCAENADVAAQPIDQWTSVGPYCANLRSPSPVSCQNLF